MVPSLPRRVATQGGFAWVGICDFGPHRTLTIQWVALPTLAKRVARAARPRTLAAKLANLQTIQHPVKNWPQGLEIRFGRDKHQIQHYT